MKWQNGGDWKDWFEMTGADGVDFVPLCFIPNQSPIYESFTKEQFFQSAGYPKSDYRFWKMINGEKYYIDFIPAEDEKQTIHTIDIYAPVEYVCGLLRSGYFEGKLHLNEQDFQLFIKDPKDFLYDFDKLPQLNFVVDDFDIDDRGEIDYVDWKEID